MTNLFDLAQNMSENRTDNQKSERESALKMALAAGAVHTADAIKNPEKCYEDILRIAAAELGTDKLVEMLGKSDAFWAYNALRSVPGLDAHRDTLLKKASETPESALHTLRFVDNLGAHQPAMLAAAGPLAQSLGSISGFNLLDQGGYNCEFTMYWTNAGVNQPSGGTPDKGTWKWSDKIMLGQSTNNLCSFFELADSPLMPGNDVWLYLWIQAGKDIESPLRFTYDPNTANKAYFVCSGTTTMGHLGFIGIQP